jgi:hypothetical protein
MRLPISRRTGPAKKGRLPAAVDVGPVVDVDDGHARVVLVDAVEHAEVAPSRGVQAGKLEGQLMSHAGVVRKPAVDELNNSRRDLAGQLRQVALCRRRPRPREAVFH